MDAGDTAGTRVGKRRMQHAAGLARAGLRRFVHGSGGQGDHGGAASPGPRRDRKEREADLHRTITIALSDSTALTEATSKVLTAVGRGFGWDVGALWVLDADGTWLRCYQLWREAGIEVPTFESASMEMRCARGIGLPGRVWAATAPAWISDVVTERNFPRAQAAAQDGLHGAFAFPVLADGQVHGVMEFFSREARRADGDLLNAMSFVGGQFGQFLKRKQTEKLMEHARERAAARRRTTEELKLTILESAAHPIITIDGDGRIIDFNSAAEQTFGYAREDVMDQLVGDVIVPPSLRERHFSALERVRETGHSLLLGKKFETTGLRADGSELPVELTINRVPLDGRVFFTACVCDITERKETEATLAQLASLVQASDDAIMGHSLDRLITSWNHGAERLFGYREAEAVGRHMSMLEPPDAEPDARGRVIAPGDPVRAQKTVCIGKGGARVMVSLTTSAVTDPGGRVTGGVTIARDISDTVGAEVAHAELEQQLHQSQKMEAIGRLASGVAHDFNNLLAVIINYANFLAQDIDDHEPAHDDVERIRSAANSAAGLVRQLLLFSRKEAVEPQVVDANQLVLSMEKLLRRTVGDDMQLETRLATDLSLTKIDPGQMEQVLMNLAVNARDAMPHGGRLSIDTSNAVVDEYLARQHGAPQGDYVRLAVSDNGAGMSPEVVAHIFEPFYTTKSEGEGTGLGLATVYAIVQGADGFITVHSEPSIGTTFNVYLPATDEQEHTAHQRHAPVAQEGRGQTILVVEDEDGVREVAERILSANGYEVLSARSGREALELCSDHPGPLHLLLTDVVMPHMSGQELVRWLRQSKQGFATILMSGYTSADLDAGELGDAAGITFLQKPFTAEELLEEVGAALSPRRVSTE